MSVAPIVLLTDFGLEGPYVGQMKGVLASGAPGHPVIDLTHAVQNQDVREGALLLETSWRYFPPHSIFAAVVDPGVGTDREAIAIEYEGRQFVGPDNGLLPGALPAGAEIRAVRLTLPEYRLPTVSSTFHGRDLFAPAAAALARGVPLDRFGPPIDHLVALPDRFPSISPLSIEGRIVHIDGFGNLVSDVSREVWNEWIETGVRADPTHRSEPEIEVGGWSGRRLYRTYGEADPGTTIALFGSLGYLEVAVSGGSAAARLGVQRGTRLSIRRSKR